MTHQKHMIKVALADDHILLRDALAALVNNFQNCQVIFTAANGMEVIEKTKSGYTPNVIIMDLNMPEVDGYETTLWLQKNYPSVNVLMLTMYDSDLSLIRLLQAGVKGFLKKDIHPEDLENAIHSVMEDGYFYPNNVTGRLVNLFRHQPGDNALLKNILTEPETGFLKLCCTEMTYKEIANELSLSPRAVDNLRDSLFNRLNVRSRVGLAMYAIRNGLVSF